MRLFPTGDGPPGKAMGAVTGGTRSAVDVNHIIPGIVLCTVLPSRPGAGRGLLASWSGFHSPPCAHGCRTWWARLVVLDVLYGRGILYPVSCIRYLVYPVRYCRPRSGSRRRPGCAGATLASVRVGASVPRNESSIARERTSSSAASQSYDAPPVGGTENLLCAALVDLDSGCCSS